MSPGGIVAPITRGRTLRDDLVKLTAIFLFFFLWFQTYKFFNDWGSRPGRAIRLARPCDVWPGLIQPWTAVIYLFGGGLIPFLPFVYNWGWEKLRVVLRAYVISSLISFTAYGLVPMSITRPPYEGSGLGERLMRWVLTVDNEANCCPSSHTTFAILAAILVAHGGAPRGVRAATWVLAVAICLTTITTGQHYFIDVPGGVVTAVVSYYAALGAQSGLRRAARGPREGP